MSRESLRIELRPIDRSNWVACVELKVSEHQVTFVAPNTVSLAQAYGQREQRPFGIYHDNQMVGFLMYRSLPDGRSIYIQRLMVDARHQRRGVGRAAMIALIDSLGAEGTASQLLLSVEPHNEVAIAFYQSLGFVLTGTADEDGELDMSRTLAAEGEAVNNSAS
jgi:diamine N-acetyltransferase